MYIVGPINHAPIHKRCDVIDMFTSICDSGLRVVDGSIEKETDQKYPAVSALTYFQLKHRTRD